MKRFVLSTCAFVLFASGCAKHDVLYGVVGRYADGSIAGAKLLGSLEDCQTFAEMAQAMAPDIKVSKCFPVTVPTGHELRGPDRNTPRA